MSVTRAVPLPADPERAFEEGYAEGVKDGRQRGVNVAQAWILERAVAAFRRGDDARAVELRDMADAMRTEALR